MEHKAPTDAPVPPGYRPRAAVVLTGDELVRGRISDRNGIHLCSWLDAAGLELAGVTIVGDRPEAIRDAIAGHIAAGVELICTSGGLGPTHDDLTLEAVASATGRRLVLDRDALALVEGRSRGLSLPADLGERTRRKQATLPEGASVLAPAGTAPGCIVQHAGSIVVVLPGPPWELRTMWRAAVADDPSLRALLDRVPGRDQRVLRIHATPESELVGALEDSPTHDRVAIGICAQEGELELTLRGPAQPVDELAAHLAERLGRRLFSDDGATLDEIVADALRARGESLAVAESCTGGGLGARLTALEGASDFIVGGVIAYDNALKSGVLGVPAEMIDEHGAVSGECARAMADGVRLLTGADWALSVTGIAGPGGGGPGKPVGLVHIGIAGPGGTRSEQQQFRGGREEVRRRSASAALHLLRRTLAGA